MVGFLYKVIVIGDNDVGKTSFLHRHVNNRYDERFKKTIGVDFLQKTIYYNDSTLRIQFWDIAGQENSKVLSRAYYKDASACIIVFDITKKSSYNSVTEWKKEVDTKLGPIPTIILANKYDLILDPVSPRSACIDDMDLDSLKDSISATGYFQVSAKTGYQVQKSMQLLERILKGISNEPLTRTDTVDASIITNPEPQEQESSRSCCN